jgi:hypothetical protein
MICAASLLNWCDAVSIAHDRLDHPIEFDLSSRKAGTISGAGGVTRCLDGRELVSIARARGKGLALRRRHQQATPDRGRNSSGIVAAKHSVQAPTLLLKKRLMARIYDCETILGTSASQSRRFAGAPSSRTSATIQIKDSRCSLGLRSFCFRQSGRHVVRAFDAPAPHHRRKPTASALRSPMRGTIG